MSDKASNQVTLSARSDNSWRVTSFASHDVPNAVTVTASSEKPETLSEELRIFDLMAFVIPGTPLVVQTISH